jgi:ribosomal protein S18 acetylase RimI-like enzyme
VTGSDAPLIRELRLRALAADPSSFGSTYERDAAYGAEVWAERVAAAASGDDRATLLAFRDGIAVGMVSAFRDDSRERVFLILGMWVAPEVRRQGVGRRLLAEAERWIAAAGGATVELSVTDRSTAARRLYEDAGYRPTGRQEASPHTPGLVEVELRKELSSPETRLRRP